MDLKSNPIDLFDMYTKTYLNLRADERMKESSDYDIQVMACTLLAFSYSEKKELEEKELFEITSEIYHKINHGVMNN